MKALAEFDLSGDSIRRVAMNAAYKAADISEAVTMEHLLSAARQEYLRLDRVFF